MLESERKAVYRERKKESSEGSGQTSSEQLLVIYEMQSICAKISQTCLFIVLYLYNLNCLGQFRGIGPRMYIEDLLYDVSLMS